MLFCPIPWIHQAIRNNGDMRVCCQANQAPDKGLLRKDDGSVYNAGVDNLNNARNCKKLKEIRLAMINGKWHPECVRCEREEKNGLRSRFTFEKSGWNHIFPQERALKETNDDGSIGESPIWYYDIRFGNKCNLKCRMCGPTDSNFWYGDYIKLWDSYYYDESIGRVKIINVNGQYRDENDIYSWYESDSFWKQLIENIPNIQRIQMVGGEPMLIKKQFDFLEKCIELGEADHIDIEHNSNIVYIPEKAWNLWKHFQCIRFGMSIDGLDKVTEYIRYPSKWNIVESNMKRLDTAEGRFQLWVTYTVQILNILELPRFINWKLQQDFNRINTIRNGKVLHDHPLHGPRFLSIKALPYEAKVKIDKYFKEFQFVRLNKEAHKVLKEYSKFMFSDDYSDDLPLFWTYNNRLDKIRGQSMKESIPDLYELIGETNVRFHENPVRSNS